MISAFPLQWPDGWPRATARKDAMFTTGSRSYMAGAPRAKALSVADGLERALNELKRLRIERDDIVVSTNVRTRMDGYPRSDEPNPSDPGVAVYWETRTGERRVMAIDIYRRVADNLAAVAASLEALRAIERHGGAQILERAFTGFTALPAPVAWHEVLGIPAGAAVSSAMIQAKYSRLASSAHPDKGGSHERMSELNQARDAALREIGA